MSFAVCRMQKMKSHDLKWMQFHNQRERESKTNHEIDKSLPIDQGKAFLFVLFYGHDFITNKIRNFHKVPYFQSIVI